MKAFGISRFQIRLMALLVVPGLVRRARFHGRKDMDQAGVCSALFNDLFNALIFPKVLATDEFDLQTILLGKPIGITADLLT